MQQLVTGKKRLLDENGVRFSGEWETCTLSEVADVYQPKQIPVYNDDGLGFHLWRKWILSFIKSLTTKLKNVADILLSVAPA
jgi:hypothetical protein